MSKRSTVLEEILNLDKEIIQLRNDSTYRKIRKSIEKLENRSFGSRTVSIPAPDNLDEEIEVRKRSEEMSSIKQRYQDRLHEFEEKLDSLHRERKILVEQIFG
jgi:hypothetical protein